MTQAFRGNAAQARRPPCTVAASKRFRGYKDEGMKSVRGPRVDEDTVLARLVEAFASLSISWPPEKMYPHSKRLIKGLKITPGLVQRFCMALEAEPGEMNFRTKAGIFLSALINKGKSSDKDIYRISVSHIPERLDHLCFRNRKNVIIDGDVSGRLGNQMEGGTVTVLGDAGVAVGENMRGGTITVKGDCDWMPGAEMRGGRIIIEGDARGDVGLGMVAGEIVVHGRIGSIGSMEPRRIYQGRRLVLDR